MLAMNLRKLQTISIFYESKQHSRKFFLRIAYIFWNYAISYLKCFRYCSAFIFLQKRSSSDGLKCKVLFIEYFVLQYLLSEIFLVLHMNLFATIFQIIVEGWGNLLLQHNKVKLSILLSVVSCGWKKVGQVKLWINKKY